MDFETLVLEINSYHENVERKEENPIEYKSDNKRIK